MPRDWRLNQRVAFRVASLPGASSPAWWTSSIPWSSARQHDNGEGSRGEPAARVAGGMFIEARLATAAAAMQS